MEKNAVSHSLLIIAGSAGSLNIILQVLPQIEPNEKLAIIILIHRKEDNDSMLAEILNNKSRIPVFEVEDKDPIEGGKAYIAPANYHLLIERDGNFSLDNSEKVQYSRPSIDVSFQSAAEVYQSNLACILLSGANADGTLGVKHVLANKGRVAVQSPDTAEVPFMPSQAISENKKVTVIPPQDMAVWVNHLF